MQTFVSETVGGIHVHLLPTVKYKLNTIAAAFHTDLEEGKATLHAMLPHVLMRGSQNYPTAESIQLALADLYGATLSGSVSKKGERQIVEFLFKAVNGNYLSHTEPLLEKGFALMSDVLFRPLAESGGFRSDYVEKEKEQHAKRIDSVLDDKIVYACERCLEEMTKGERFAIPKLGRKSDLGWIDGKNLFDTYREMVAAAPMHIYVIGNVKRDEVIALVEKYMQPARRTEKKLLPAQTDAASERVREIVERLDVIQGKLNIGLRTGITHADDMYPALLVYNGLLGGFPHSKLFLNVREKASLAYYASSRLESYKGLLYIQSGIQIENYGKALDIIKRQLEEMKAGHITDEELAFTKSGLINSFRTVQDSPEGLVDLHTGGLVSGRQRTVEELIELVQKVKREDVVRIAERVRLDTIYFLRDREGGTDHA